MACLGVCTDCEVRGRRVLLPVCLTCIVMLGLLNWWTSTGKLSQLEPLATSGDGNCLLHATSLYMWGLQDQQLILRNSLYKLLTTGSKKDAIFKRWKHQTELRNKEAGGLTFSEEEWQFEWAEIIRVANSKPRRAPSTESLRRYSTLRLNYESLEEIHVFALAHVLKRPIIVVADRVLRSISGDELAPIYFGGIYLPLEEKTVCCQSPVVLTYHASHFAALVAKEDSKGAGPGKGGAESAIPLVTPDGKLLPLQFDNEVSAGRRSSGEYDPRTMQLLNQYFKIKWFQLAASPYAKSGSVPGDDDSDYDHLTPSIRFPAACIEHKSTPIYQQTLIQRYIENARTRFEEGKLQRHQQEEEKAKREEERRKKEEEQQMKRPVPCRGKGCDMFGTPATKFLCSSCSKLSQTDGTFSVQPVSPGLPSSPDIATPSSPSVVNPCQTSDYSRQNSKSKIPTQPSQHSSSKEIPPSAVLHSSSSSPKVQAPLSPPQPAVAKQHSNKPVFLETSGTTKAPVDQARKVPLAPQSSSLTKDTKSDSTHLEPKSGTPPCGSAASNPTKLPAAAKPGRVMHVRPTPGKYSRDSIQPLTANDKGTCATDGCGFYSSGQSQYCTKCRAARPPE